jgi:hypothetical protein
MTRRTIASSLLVVTCLVVAGCSPSSPGSLFAFTPGPAPMVYTGTMMDSMNGNGTLTVSLVNAAGLVSGTWSMLLGGIASSLCISGTVSGSTYTASLADCNNEPSRMPSAAQPVSLLNPTLLSGPDCQLAFTGSLTSSSLRGTYTANSDRCPAQTGSISATRQ